MKRFLLWTLVVLIVGVGGLVAWLALRSPEQRPASTEKIEATPERLARGQYLVENVADCFGCHSDHLWDRFACPIKDGTKGQGGFAFDAKLGVPGLVQAQNITQDKEHGLGDWTDGEILRALREGVDRKGVALFPMMPYEYFHDMSDEDAKSVVAFLRTIPAVNRPVAPRRLDFPVNLLIKFAPQPLTGPVSAPDRSDSVAYGKYLVNVAGCRECHTPHDDKGKRIPGADFSGGWVMPGPWGRVVTANLTPDPDNYMGQASRDEFIGRFKSFETLGGANAPAAPRGKNTVMAWPVFAGMTKEDLGAIYDYLKTQKPVKKKINSFPDAPPEAAAPVVQKASAEQKS
ncbi:MAG TPA: cytochrome C [Thermoanaerobaculia bacterium]|nr:cytochrome C [Thermoanaerobaculia bacterium]